jgi:hypothetical protein
VVARGDMTLKQRDQLLATMTDEVAALVLADNYLQTQALSVAEADGIASLHAAQRFMRGLEKAGRLNRAIEFLPDEEEFRKRQAAGRGLTRPELAVLLAYPLSLHPSSLRFPTGPDGEIGWYLLGWDTHAFLHKPWAIFDANIYYPQRLTLAYGENLIGIAVFAAPVIWLTGNLLPAANFAALLSCVLCGVGAYVLARRVGLSVAAAVICGIVFECAPPRFFRIEQINLPNVQWIPFGLAALHTYLDGGRKRDLHLAAGYVSLQALSSGHGAVFMGVALLLFVL